MPGTATQSSGYTSQLIQNALACDRQRVLASLRTGAVATCATPRPETKSAQAASVLEQLAQQSCQITGKDALLLPRAGVPESVRIQRVQSAVLTASVNPLNPETRFSAYTRFVPQAPCPPPTAEQLNSTQPTAPLIGCQPSRFF